MVRSLELGRIAAFSNLPDDQINWFLAHVEEVPVRARVAFVRQGNPADWMVIFLEGFFQWRGEFGGDTVSLPAQAGDISGIFSFLPDETVYCHWSRAWPTDGFSNFRSRFSQISYKRCRN